MEQNKYLKPLLLLGGAGLLYVALQASKFVFGLKVEFRDMFLGGTLISPVVFATLKITNPSDITVKLNRLTGKIFYQDTFVSDVESVYATDIEPNAIIYLDLKLQSKLGNMLETISQLIKTKAKKDYVFDGFLTVNGLTIPYKTKLA
jgi:hypothetical protein